MTEPELSRLHLLQTEGRNPRTGHIDTLPTLDVCKLINEEDASVARAVQSCLPEVAAAIDEVVPRIRNGGRLIYVGAGTSGRLGILDASEIPPTFSASPNQFVGIIAGGDAAIRNAQERAEDDVSAAISDFEALDLSPELDIVLGIAASGRTPYVLSSLKYAKRLGCLTIGLSCSFPSDMSSSGFVDHMLSVVTGPEVVTGSTRLKAGTATKMVLNMLSTGAMIKLGKTYGNMMVDLKATNLKLNQRSRNIIRAAEPTASKLADEKLDELIASCGGSVKLALMTLKTGLSQVECEGRLEIARGVLSQALDNLEVEKADVNLKASGNTSSGCPPRKLAVCIDGGGTKCAVAVADQDGNVGRGEAGSCNFTDVGLEGILQSITLATKSALQDLNRSTGIDYGIFPSLNTSKFSPLLAGIAGFDRPGASKLIEPGLSSLFCIPIGPSLRVTNDVDMLTLTIHKYPNLKSVVVLIAGTGSIALSYKIEDGTPIKTGRSGGWGHILGDDGSGFDLGRRGIRSTLAALERSKLRTSTSDSVSTEGLRPIHYEIMRTFGGAEAGHTSFDLLSQVLQSNSSDLKLKIAGIAPIVLDAARTDEQAASITASAVRSLVSTLTTLISPDNIRPKETVLVLAGGLMRNEAFREIAKGKINEASLEFGAVDVVTDAVLAGVKSLISVDSRSNEVKL